MRRGLLPSRAKGFIEPESWLQPNLLTTSVASGRESIGNDFNAYVEGAYKANGIVFACILARQLVFSEARFQFQTLQAGRPGKLYGTQALDLLEVPWANGTTGDLLSRMEQDASLAGNFYGVRVTSSGKPRLRRLDPGKVTILVGNRETAKTDPFGVTSEVIGYFYRPSPMADVEAIAVKDMVHYAPIPDPVANYRGMSWMTPVLTEIQSDTAATKHKAKFFQNGATPSTVITYDKSVDPAKLKAFAEAFRDSHVGTDNAYKTLHLGGGSDVKAYGSDFKQLDFKTIQGAGETRIAAASGVGAIIAQFSEGLGGSSLNAGNYAAARRRFADMTMRPLWRMAASALAPVVEVPAGSRLWFDDRDIPFLQEDRKDAASIQQTQAATIRTLVEAGFEPSTVLDAVGSEDMSLLVHSGRTSVQLQTPSTTEGETSNDG